MTHKMFFAGSGGQGIMLMGQIVASAAIYENKSTTFFPSYGPEMRGGTANCTVIISNNPISSPLISESDIVAVMNLPSQLKFEPTLKAGGIMLRNKSIIQQAPKRDDITIIDVDANVLAEGLGDSRVANMIMLGAFAKNADVVASDAIEKAIRDAFESKGDALVELNVKAFHKLM